MGIVARFKTGTTEGPDGIEIRICIGKGKLQVVLEKLTLSFFGKSL